MKVDPNPLFAAVVDWPQVLEGTIELCEGDFSVDLSSGKLSKEEVLASFTGVATLDVSEKDYVFFMLDGSVLLPSMIWPEEIDSGMRFRVSLEPKVGMSSPYVVGRTGKLRHSQVYKAIRIDRV